ncbi:FAD-dependent oxidoreductase [Rhodoblastus acidophilus]|uniref:FAD-dependent oxidoreductase n=1 Tax=Candidatus Rhodoblastus alkanivorans TaxID=2954117 RepID=A0ABS9Z2N0_9HYPH|nr:FAD-dependent oxidoreductase [Candidatus Rhodoblastus alkanivorans]MCI4679019.1 FAD-dependent oxidoreductase [Candidatus Rhodoblastus alkanivorans]MCI4681726.1 FAD-dependent oxidoreductase [Candidatus Rhodoblastus alkanivorans]MDI4642775.1 FAD-dependent oxidoreductase [Rhodoblastus acidophilus]
MANCKPFSVDLTQDQSGLPHYEPPPCQVACPIGTDVASYVGMIWEGKTAEALEAIAATNPLSGVCGRVCDAPCEPACRRAGADGPVAIRALKRYVLDALGPTYRLPAVAPDKAKRVAIIGAGPAGLTAAQDIAFAGYPVDLYEAQSKPGGMALWGIPDFRLPQSVVQDDIDRILQRCPGISLHLDSPLGEKVKLEDLRRSHDAVLLAIGASAGKKLGIPGDDGAHVIDGVTFLNRVNGGDRPVLPKTIVVIGGGDVAMDACRSALRLGGVEKVIVAYRRGPAEIPARRYELEAARAEGVEFLYNVAPVAVLDGDDQAVLRCKKTALGAPGVDGRRVFSLVEGSDFDLACGLVIAAVGQKAASLELARHGLMDGDRILTRASDMGTKLERVFAAGDAAFGSSTLVQAMFQGHKAAYYVLAALEGVAHPAPYRTPYRTRNVPVAQDQMWEKLPHQEPPFLGVGKPDPFSDAEAGYDARTARDQAARCYRCDTETGSADYSVKTREAIFALARVDARPADFVAATRARLARRPDPLVPGPATLDEMVFLPANLTRLVIDPYREACKTATALGAGLRLAQPMLIAGFEDAPDGVRKAVAKAIDEAGSAYVGRAALPGAAPWLQIVDRPESADPVAAAVLLRVSETEAPALPANRPGQLRGLIATWASVERVVAFALAQRVDLVVLDGSGHFGGAWADLAGAPDLSLLPRAVGLMREAGAEEAFPLIWFGGLRSGTDLAKMLALGAGAGIVDVAAGLAAGGAIAPSGLDFPAEAMERAGAGLASYLKAAASECSMMARCCGKTNVHNLEPEDLRTTSLRAQQAVGIAMAGRKKIA